jgi:alkanesulfonate monooxygenase SsuD/methylene tetrahydromethanopterin reductase-like flavin-dependent oxidoreductase (luciferase family)
VKIGIGLPNPVPDTDGHTLRAWAARAQEAGFSSLATIDRLVYPSYESLVSLAAAAAVTERIGLISNILIAPLRPTLLLAKEAASVDRLSGGRLTLGLASGGREDDFVALGADFRTRGRRFDEQLERMREIWRGKVLSDSGRPSVPRPGKEVPILIGGTTDKAVERVTTHGVGWTAGGGGPDRAAPMVNKVRKAWSESGRSGEARIVTLTYFALGPGADEGAISYLTDYYAYLGEWTEQVARSAPTTPSAIKGIARRFEDIGADELIFDPTIAKLDQIDRLAETLL